MWNTIDKIEDSLKNFDKSFQELIDNYELEYKEIISGFITGNYKVSII